MTIRESADVGELTQLLGQEKEELMKRIQEMSEPNESQATDEEDVDAAEEYVEEEEGSDLFEGVSTEEGPVLKEWMYSQRLIFINNYYCPRDLDELLRIFLIRLKDWTVVSKISINL